MTSTVESVDRRNLLLLASTFVIAACGLIYELLAGSLSSYLLGDSVYQFSIVIGIFMAAMGLGSYLSRHITEGLIEAFVILQLTIGLCGGLSALILFAAFGYSLAYEPLLIALSIIIGTQIGFEIPLILRILREYNVLRINVSNVLTVDYIGALVAALVFPLLLVPQLGLIRTGVVFGLLNVLVGGLGAAVFWSRISARAWITLGTIIASLVLVVVFLFAERLTTNIEQRLYSGEIIFAESTAYQRIIISRDRDTLSLFLDGALQFNSRDEYRYHEPLVHPAMQLNRRRENVLILGGGDGLALREVLKYDAVKSVTLVDLDARVTELFSVHPLLTPLNNRAFADERVTVIHTDARKFFDSTSEIYDVIIIDLPDPRDISLSRLYTREFYAAVSKHLAVDGVLATQATSPLYAPEAYWSIETTLRETPSTFRPGQYLSTRPLHAYVPTFGEWGFVLAAHQPLPWPPRRLALDSLNLKFLTPSEMARLGEFPPDMARVDALANTLVDHPLVKYYQEAWARWFN
ncbi:MAG: polyamine aminopropyltransferase [Pseudomonadota bacterium]